MKIYDAKAGKGTKLCQLNAGRLVKVYMDDGTESIPLLLMSNNAYKRLSSNGAPAPWGSPPPAAPPLPAAGYSEQSGFQHSDVRLLDPITGDVWVTHGSTRARTLDNAAVVLNYIENAGV